MAKNFPKLMNTNQCTHWEAPWAQTRQRKIIIMKTKTKTKSNYNKLLKSKSKYVKAARDIKDTWCSRWWRMDIGLTSRSCGTGAHTGTDAGDERSQQHGELRTGVPKANGEFQGSKRIRGWESNHLHRTHALWPLAPPHRRRERR